MSVALLITKQCANSCQKFLMTLLKGRTFIVLIVLLVFFSIVNDSHPTLIQRVRALNEYKNKDKDKEKTN